eukprot:9482810-Pyramimonas_sp.AAC.1
MGKYGESFYLCVFICVSHGPFILAARADKKKGTARRSPEVCPPASAGALGAGQTEPGRAGCPPRPPR